MEGVLDVLVKQYKSTGRNSRGKMCKRDASSLRKAAVKCSRGVRLDVQEVLQISDVSVARSAEHNLCAHSDAIAIGRPCRVSDVARGVRGAKITNPRQSTSLPSPGMSTPVSFLFIVSTQSSDTSLGLAYVVPGLAEHGS